MSTEMQILAKTGRYAKCNDSAGSVTANQLGSIAKYLCIGRQLMPGRLSWQWTKHTHVSLPPV